MSNVVGLDPGEIEERLDGLGLVHGVVRPLRELQLPDGTPAVRYRFVHVLYQNVLYARLNPTRRAALSRAVAEALLAHYGDRKADIAKGPSRARSRPWPRYALRRRGPSFERLATRRRFREKCA